MRFKDRTDAGQQLAHALGKYKGQESVVYALPRGGVVPAAIVAEALEAPLDLLIPRKIGHPYNPEYAIAAFSEGGYYIANQGEGLLVNTTWFAEELGRQRKEAERRRRLYMANRKPLPVQNKVAIVIDDGIATGLTMQVTVQSLKQYNPKKIVVAVPVAPADTVKKLEEMVDEVIVLHVPADSFGAVGAYYDDFPQVSDEEVITLLKTNPLPIPQHI